MKGAGDGVSGGRKRVRAAAAADDRGVLAAPAEVVVEHGRVISVGPVQDHGDRAGCGGEVIDLSHCVLLPGLINAHTHLDLTAIGNVPLPDDASAAARFGGWLAAVRAARLTDPARIRASVEAGAALARAGGTAFVGDIAGGDPRVVLAALRSGPLAGIAFAEVFGLGDRQPAGIDQLEQLVAEIPPIEGGFRLGLQPHALYSAGPDVFRHCAGKSAQWKVPMATHLAESEAERAFALSASGPMADRLHAMGVWNDAIRPIGLDPVPGILRAAGSARLLAVHVNDIRDEEIELLARAGASVVYCPRAAAFFGHCVPPERPHAWRRMVAAGVRVALGTDGVVCLDRCDRISPLDDMRFLMDRDGATALQLLPMVTAHAAEALGIPAASARLGREGRAGMIAVAMDGQSGTHLDRAVRGQEPPIWVVEPSDPWTS